MSEDIVVQLRGWSEGSSDDSRRMVWLMRQSADTIEALRGEVERLRSTFNAGTVEQILKVTQDRAEKAEAEAARLKGALEEAVKWMEGCAVGGGYPAWYVKARKALAGETT